MATSALALEEEFETSISRPKPRLWSAAKLQRWVVRLVSLGFFIGLWQVASTQKAHVLINFANVPAPSEVYEAAVDFAQSPRALRNVTSSVTRIFFGFGIAALLAIPLGVLIGRARVAEDVLLTPLEILRPIPAVAWIPLAILMFTTAEQSMVYICFIGAFYPILLSTIHGVEALDQRLIFASQSLGAGPWGTFWGVILPGTLPSIVTGLSIGMGTCWFSLVTAEMVAGKFGIGYFTWESYTLQNYPSIVVGMLLIGFLGMLSSKLVRVIGESLMPWHRLQSTR